MRALHRRQFLRGSLTLTGVGLLAGCGILPAPAQPAHAFRVGIVFPAPRPAESAPTPRLDALREGLRGLDWVEGRNVALEPRWSDQFAEVAAELVRLPSDVIVVEGSAAIRAIAQATSTIPIVAMGAAPAAVPDRIASFARPGGNVTGLTRQFPGLPGKRLELLKEIAPRSTRPAILWDVKALPREEQAGKQQQALLEDAARSLGVQLQILEVRAVDDLEGAFETATAGRADTLFVADLQLFHIQATRIAQLAAQHRLPAIGPSREYTRMGGADLLRDQRPRPVAARGELRRQDPQGRQRGRPADRAAREVRPRAQPEDRPSSGVDYPAVDSAAGHRDHRVATDRFPTRPRPRRPNCPLSCPSDQP